MRSVQLLCIFLEMGVMKREAGGQGEFSVGRIFGAATPPGRGRIFGAATPPGALDGSLDLSARATSSTSFFIRTG